MDGTPKTPSTPQTPGAHNPLMAFLGGNLPFAAQLAASAASRPASVAVAAVRKFVLCEPGDPPVIIQEPKTPLEDIDFERVGRHALKQVKAGTLGALVAWLAYYVSCSDQRKQSETKSTEVDLDYADVFFMCFSRFTTPPAFVSSLRRFFDDNGVAVVIVCSS
jgi:hypothetical protein